MPSIWTSVKHKCHDSSRTSSGYQTRAGSLDIAHGGSDNLIRRRQPGEHFADAVFAKRAHAHFTRAIAQHGRRDLFVNQLAGIVIDYENLKNTKSAAEPGVGTISAAFPAHEAGPLGIRNIEVKLAHFVLCRNVRGTALFADFAHEALRHQSTRRGGNQEWLDPDINETGNSARGIIGMQRRKDQVTRQGSVNGNRGCLEVTNFPNHYHVRGLTQD